MTAPNLHCYSTEYVEYVETSSAKLVFLNSLFENKRKSLWAFSSAFLLIYLYVTVECDYFIMS